MEWRQKNQTWLAFDGEVRKGSFGLPGGCLGDMSARLASAPWHAILDMQFFIGNCETARLSFQREKIASLQIRVQHSFGAGSCLL